MRRHWTWVGVSTFATALAVAALVAAIVPLHRDAVAQPRIDPETGLPLEEVRELKAHAKRLGMEVPELLAARDKAEQEMHLARAKQAPQMLVHEGSLFLLDREWLFQFDVKTLEVKNVHNLEILRHEFMEKFEQERHQQEQQRRKQQGKAQ